MKIAHRNVKTDKRKISVVIISDAHLGSIVADKQLFIDLLAYIEADKTRLWLLCGDLFESIMPSDPRFDLSLFDFNWHELMAQPDFIREFPFLMADKLEALLKPIAKQGICMNLGNHEYKSAFRGVIQETAKRLGVTYGGWTSQIKLIFEHKSRKVPKRSVILQAEHGYSAPRTLSGLTAVMARRMGEFERPDVIVWGHAHTSIFVPVADIGANRETEGHNVDGYDARLRWGVVCPALSDAYSTNHITYAERRQFPPSVKGVVELDIDLWDYRHPFIVPKYAILKLAGG